MKRSLARNITLVNSLRYLIIENSSGGWTRTSTSQLQRLVGCQLPNAGILAVASREIAAAAAVRTRYRPNRDGGIGGSRAPGVRLAVPDDAPDLGHAGRSPAFDPAVEIRAAADVNAQATAAHAIMWAVP